MPHPALSCRPNTALKLRGAHTPRPVLHGLDPLAESADTHVSLSPTAPRQLEALVRQPTSPAYERGSRQSDTAPMLPHSAPSTQAPGGAPQGTRPNLAR